MKRATLLALGVAIAVCGPGDLAPTKAVADPPVQIACPAEAVHQITSAPGMAGWTPAALHEKLRATSVAPFDKGNWLVCDYGPAGTLTRHPPPNTTCSAQAGGFTCFYPGPPPFGPPPPSQPH